MSLLPGSAIPLSGYNIYNSLRFRASATAFLSRTPTVAGNRTTWTWSAWVKRGQLSIGNSHQIMAAGDGTISNRFAMSFNLTTDTIAIANSISGSDTVIRATTQVFRDPSAWYHIVLAVNTTQATAANRTLLYVNGAQITAFTISNDLPLNYDTYFNSSAFSNRIGVSVTGYFDGYMAEVNFIDGQALTPSSFGSTNATTGVWQPAQYTGTYGTNGFYLKFSDIATTSGSNTGLGRDFSGNGNFWNTNNISVTAGVTYDAMTDVPTLTSSTVANYPVLNPLDRKATQNTFSEGNLRVTTGTTEQGPVFATMMLPQGKWYAEFYITNAASAEAFLGVANIENINEYCMIANFFPTTGRIYVNGTIVQTGFTGPVTGDTVSVLADVTAGSYIFWINGTQVGTAQSATVNNPSFTMFDGRTSFGTTYQVNFGQRPFTYTPPTGFNRLNTFNLPTSTILKGNHVMDATTYSGNSTVGTNITNSGAMRPDMVWIKKRSAAMDHFLVDSVRGLGASSTLSPNLTTVEQYQFVTAFNSNGFQVNADTAVNATGSTYVGWQWQAGQGTTSSNTAGSITSTVSVNATAGFSVVTYTGTGSAASIGHGLGVTPEFIMVKRRNVASNWMVVSRYLSNYNWYLKLNLTDAQVGDATIGNIDPSPTTFNVGTNAIDNASGGTYVAYVWAPIAGFSKFGSYTGNGSADGPFVYLGFRPKFVLVKNATTGGAGYNWNIFDSTRDPFNVVDLSLQPNLANAEFTEADLDFTANGFKLRVTNVGLNANGATIIYAAFAENPFKNALAR